ncbi:MAG: hypothetical protein M1531_06250 [Chloroflexi bacterium]|nr:hypothetical protein [Chloroflexota bacterium]
MAKYLIELEHEEGECVPSVEKLMERGPEFLGDFDWGCEVGVHRAWGTVEAETEAEARRLLPVSLQDRAHVIKVTKKTPAGSR